MIFLVRIEPGDSISFSSPKRWTFETPGLQLSVGESNRTPSREKCFSFARKQAFLIRARLPTRSAGSCAPLLN